MSYIGKTPTAIPLTSSDIADSIITSAKISDGTVAQADISDQAINEAKMQISNSPTNGYFLSAQSGNTGGLTWAEAGGGGKLLQVATDFDSGQITINSTTYTDTGLSIDFTPTASNSTLLIFACVQLYTEGNGSYYGASNMKILHDGSTVQEVFTSLSDHQSGAFSYFRTHIASVSASNTNQRTIKVQINKGSNSNNPNALYNQYSGNSSLIIQEIGA